MKNYLKLVVVFALALASCSKDDDAVMIIDNGGEIILSDEKQITAFKFLASENASLDIDVIAIVNNETKTIAATVPAESIIDNLKPNIEISEKAIVTPNNETAQDFSNTVTYTVTAEDGTTQKYEVIVTEDITNEFIGGGTAFPLDQAKAFKDTRGTNTGFVIWLFSSDVNVVGPFTIEGKGDGIFINFINDQGVIEGEYDVDFDSLSGDEDFPPILPFVDTDFDNPSEGIGPTKALGKISITKKGDQYIIKADVTYTFSNGLTEELKVTYKGILPVS
ncbi:DUF5018 domain-containing protein [Aquimarina mytili]|uniref:DUF5018 domain-containing protein n=1 Tax=Aquimarina mytili TaxID=874423 RepID=A0A937A229_9FLAO|nr:DUF5018 domain-containing protein [Aquimarina mytili]MBL0685456.1 DUF5018 domain-containing protein [Aquimarina mytili]